MAVESLAHGPVLVDTDTGVQPYRFTASQYRRIYEKGVLPWALRTELLDGEVFEEYRRGAGPHRWSREEYYRLADAGIFRENDRVQLIAGEIVEMSPQKPPHAVATHKAAQALRRTFGRRFHVRTQLPLALSPHAEPEPDAAVIPGKPEDYAEDHPKSAALVLEVADTSLRTDRGPKASLYASAGIADYWVLNMVVRQLEVHRDPAPDARAASGYSYRTRTIVGADEGIVPLGAPSKTVQVSDLLP